MGFPLLTCFAKTVPLFKRALLPYITPEKPTENGFTASLNDKIRDECVNQPWFISLQEAKNTLQKWRIDYHFMRLHSSLGYFTPPEIWSKDPEQGDSLEVALLLI